MTELAIRTAAAADWPAVSRLLADVFFDTAADPNLGDVFEPDRSLLVEDEGAVVAHAGVYTRELAVPGATMPAAHITMVGVAPTHRRRRLLTRLMHRQLAEVPEPVAVLWASEGRIYPRFGYGMATQRVSLRVDTREVRLPEPAAPGRVRSVCPAEAAADLRRVYEAVRADRPGWSGRSERWWDAHVLADPPEHRHGATELRVALHHSRPGAPPDGYALWRAKSDWDASGPQGEVRVSELVATNPDAHLGLWRFLLAIDLTRSATIWRSGLDEPLLYLVDEPRRLGSVLGDGLFVRIVDLPRALAARRYAAPLDVVLDVTDPLLAGNAGRWRLTAGPERAECTRTDDPADLACGIGDLGAAYLGGVQVGALAVAGRVRELRPGAVPAASAAFGWHRPPTAIEVF